MVVLQTLKENFRKPIFSCYQHIKCIKTYFWYLNMSPVDLATRFKNGMYMLNREMRY